MDMSQTPIHQSFSVTHFVVPYSLSLSPTFFISVFQSFCVNPFLDSQAVLIDTFLCFSMFSLNFGSPLLPFVSNFLYPAHIFHLFSLVIHSLSNN